MLFVTSGALVKQLESEFSVNYEEISVGSLFKATDGLINLQCIHLLSTVDVPADLIKCLFVVGKKNQNVLFKTCWDKQCMSCDNLSSFTEVYEKVCGKVVQECIQILISLEQRSITLEEVEECFWKYEVSELMQNLLKLCQGIQEYSPTNNPISPGKSWIPSVVDNIQVYKQISGYTNTAKVVLKLRDSMKLSGDFTTVDTIAKQVCD